MKPELAAAEQEKQNRLMFTKASGSSRIGDHWCQECTQLERFRHTWRTMPLTGTSASRPQPLDVPTQFNLHQTSHAKKAPVKLPALAGTTAAPRVSGSKRENALSDQTGRGHSETSKVPRVSSSNAHADGRDMVRRDAVLSLKKRASPPLPRRPAPPEARRIYLSHLALPDPQGADVRTGAEVVEFYSHHGHSSSVKFFYCLPAKSGLKFRPYDLVRSQGRQSSARLPLPARRCLRNENAAS